MEEDMEEDMDKSNYDSIEEEGGDSSRSTSKLRSPAVPSHEEMLNHIPTEQIRKSIVEIEMPRIDESEENESDQDDSKFIYEGGSNGPKSDISGRSRGGYSANASQKSRANSYAPSAGGGGSNDMTSMGGGAGGKRRSARDYQKMEIATSRIICLNFTPRCCRTKGQTALNKLLTKGQNKLHRELDIGPFLKRTRDSQNLVLSYMNSRCFNPSTLYTDYQQHYSNVIDVDLNTERSIEEEFAQPIGVDYMEPQPVCVCPDLGEENLVKIAETAYGILKCETELNQKIGDSIRKKKSMKGIGSGSRGGKSHQGDNPTTLEGGWEDNIGKLNMSHQSYRTHKQKQTIERDSQRPSIIAPAGSDRSGKGVDRYDQVDYDAAMKKRLSDSTHRKSDESQRPSNERSSYKSRSKNHPRPSSGDRGDDMKSQYSARSSPSPRSKQSKKTVDHNEVQLKPKPVVKEEDGLSMIAENTNSLATPINGATPTPPTRTSVRANVDKSRRDDDAVSSKSRKSSRSKSSSKKVKKEVKEERQDRRVASSSNDKDIRSKSKSKKVSRVDKRELEVVPESEMDGLSDKTYKSSKSRRHKSKDQERSRSKSAKKKRE